MLLLRTLAFRALGLLGVLLAVLVLVVVVLGATGVSDNILQAIIREEIQAVRENLAKTIRDPDQLEVAVQARRQDLVRAYGLDRPWYWRLPQMVRRVVTLDLGEARTVRSFGGSARVSHIVLERLPITMALFFSATVVISLVGLFLGAYVAMRPGSLVDRAVSYLSAGSYALPAWWTAILLILVLGYYLKLFPTGGMFSTPPPSEIGRASCRERV